MNKFLPYLIAFVLGFGLCYLMHPTIVVKVQVQQDDGEDEEQLFQI